MLYRDIKPYNIGFDVRGDVKLFDFGLAREMPYSTSSSPTSTSPGTPPTTSNSSYNPNEVYHMTSCTGSFRYMAPEVNQDQAYYNQSMDVYSFGILLWQMMFLETPFKNHFSPEYHKKMVAKGTRPSLNVKKLKQWSPSLKDLLTRCWSTNLTERPDIRDVMAILKEEIPSTYYGRGQELDFSDRTGDSWISMKSQSSNPSRRPSTLSRRSSTLSRRSSVGIDLRIASRT